MPTKKELAKLHAAANRVRKLQAERYKQASDGETVSVGSMPPPDLTKVPRTREAFEDLKLHITQHAMGEGRQEGFREGRKYEQEQHSEALALRKGEELATTQATMTALTDMARHIANLSEGLSRVMFHTTRKQGS